MGHGTWDMGPGTWDQGHGTRDMGHGTRDMGHGTWDRDTSCDEIRIHLLHITSDNIATREVFVV